MKPMSDGTPDVPHHRPRRTPGTGFTRAFVALALLLGLTAWASPQMEKHRAIAELAAAGLSWDESKRAITVTDDGRTKLKDLTAIQGALRELQPRSLDLTSCALHVVDSLRGVRTLQAIYLTDCPALRNVDGIAASDQLKKIYLFESLHISPASLAALQRRFPKC
jgi:hypothetical protein